MYQLHSERIKHTRYVEIVELCIFFWFLVKVDDRLPKEAEEVIWEVLQKADLIPCCKSYAG